MRKISKDKLAKLNGMKYEVAAAKANRDAVDKKGRILQEKKEKMETFNQSISEKSDLLKPIRRRLEEITESEDAFTTLKSEFASKEAERKGEIQNYLQLYNFNRINQNPT